MNTVLTVDDHAGIRESLRSVLESEGLRCLEAESGQAARQILSSEKVDLVLLDVFLGDLDGLTLLEETRRSHPEIAVVMISGEADIPIALKAMRLGAYDFLEKPLGRSKLKITIRNALASVAATRESREARNAQLNRWSFIGHSVGIQEVQRFLDKAAQSTISVLITGENGTGKEIAAHRLHFQSARWARPLVKVNCTAIPANLLESELFGHTKGSFTGAVADKKGLFLEADQGTIFLDEIGDMSPALQAKLLRVLQEREVTRLGEATPRTVDVRIVAATNRNVQQLIRDGALRQDLYFRLAGLEVVLPPLRHRPEDIPELVDDLVRRYCFENNRRIPRVAERALRQIESYAFPGNVRELKNVVERTIVMLEGDVIDTFLLTAHASVDQGEEEMRGPLRTVKRELMRRHIRRRLAALRGDRRLLAAELGIHLNNLYRVMREHGIESQRSSGASEDDETED